MTNEEAIKKMQAVKAYMISGNPIWSVTEMGEAFDMAIESLKQNQWIPCEERLPEAGADVLVTTDRNSVSIARRVIDYRWFFEEGYLSTRFEDVIAWMPKPKAYEGRTE